LLLLAALLLAASSQIAHIAVLPLLPHLEPLMTLPLRLPPALTLLVHPSLVPRLHQERGKVPSARQVGKHRQ